MRLTGSLWLALALPCLGCGGSSGEDPDGSVVTDADPNAPDANPGAPIFGASEGSIVVSETSYPGSPSSYGEARVSFEPTRTSFHREQMRSGACRLLRYEATLCNPACQFNELCGENGCVPFPTYQSAGTVTLGGLATAVTVSWQGGYYYPDQALPGELFSDSATVTASAPGDTFPAFTVTAGGVSAADLLLGGAMNDELALIDGADMTMSWSSAEAGARVRLTLTSPNDGHGLPANTIIECDAPDTGSIVIPRAIVEAFPAQQRLEICVGHDCPPSTFMRYRRGTANTASGEVELLVAFKQLFYLTH